MATRRERVVLELETNFPLKAAEAAAAIRLLNEEVNRIGGRGGNSRPIKQLGDDIEKAGTSTRQSGAEIDKLSGRLRVLGQSAAILGPALAPIGALAVPAITGLASSFGFAAIGAGTAVLAFQGVGDALKAMNKAQLEPTQANLDAARVAMEQISPAAQSFVKELQNLTPELDRLQEIGAAGLFPGLAQGIQEIQTALPAVERIILAVSSELGSIGARAGAALGGAQYADFFTFLENEAPRALGQMASGLGNVAHAMAQVWIAFAPLNRGFLSWVVDATNSLDQWASSLSKTQGFADFINYVQSTGPQVASTMGALANALLQIVEAAAPLGGPVLQAIEGIANAMAAIAGSPAGPTIMAAVTALSLLGRAQAVFGRVASTSWATSIRGAEGFSAKVAAGRGPLLRGGAALAGFGLAASGAADGIGLSNTASLALMGTLAGPWGAAVGGAVGLVMDLSKSHHTAAADVASLTQTLDQQTGAVTRNTQAFVAGEFEKDGVLKSANSLGLSLSDVTSAALGNAGAMARVTAGLEAAKTGFYDADGRIQVGADTLNQYRENSGKVSNAIGDTSKALDSSQSSFGRVAEAAGRAGGQVGAASAALQRANARIIAARGAASTTAHAFVTLGDSLDDAKVSLNDWIRQMARQAQALTNFGNNARKAADKGLRQGLIAALQEAGPAGAMRMRQLSNATESEINKANRAWSKGQRAIRSYTDTVGGVPKSKTTTIQTNADIERRRVQALQAAINALHGRTVTNYINTIRRGNLDGRGPVASGTGIAAEGTTVPKTGKPYADRHLYMLADGEEVISNRYGQADRHRDLLKAINANRLAGGGTAGIPGLAKGGSVRISGARRAHDLRELADFREALADSTAAINKEKSARDAIASKRSELSSTVSGQFKSDIFGGSAWAAGGAAGGAFGILKADIAKAKAFQSTLGGLRKRGLDGDALAELAKTGDIGKAQAFASMSTKDLRTYESLFNQRTAAANNAGAYAGYAAYAAEQAKANGQLHTLVQHAAAQQRAINALTRELRSHPKKTGDHVGHAINSAASKGQRNKRGHK